MKNDASNRRRFLVQAAAATGTLGLAGCLTGGSDSSDGEGAVTTTTDGDGTGGDGTSGDGTSGGETITPGETGTTEGTGTEAGTETPSPSGTATATESPRTVSFEAPHGATIEATAYGSGDCGVVLVPQVNLDRGSWRPQVEMIAGMDHLALAIDEDPDDRAASVRGAIRHLREQRDVSTVVLVGASTGGEAVVVANATTDVTVDGTITLSAAGGTDHASDLQGRSLFVVGKEDEERFVRIARELHQGAPEPKELVEYEGSAHGQGIFDSEHGDDLRDRVRTFVSDVCEG